MLLSRCCLLSIHSLYRESFFTTFPTFQTSSNNSVAAAQSNREILPASFDVEELVRDYQLATTLTELLTSMRQLTEQVDDTLLAVGSEVMSSSLTVYDYVKTAAKKTPGLKTVAEQLGERFKAIRSKSTKAASAS
jgi:hypothetical protein